MKRIRIVRFAIQRILSPLLAIFLLTAQGRAADEINVDDAGGQPGQASNIKIDSANGDKIEPVSWNTDLKLGATGTGKVRIGSVLEAEAANTSLQLQGNGTGGVVLNDKVTATGGVQIRGNDTPTNSTGVELGYDTGNSVGILSSITRGSLGDTIRAMRYNALSHTFRLDDVDRMKLITDTSVDYGSVYRDGAFVINPGGLNQDLKIFGYDSTTVPALWLDSRAIEGRPQLRFGGNEGPYLSHMGVDLRIHDGSLSLASKTGTHDAPGGRPPFSSFWRSRVDEQSGGVHDPEIGDILGYIQWQGYESSATYTEPPDADGVPYTTTGAWISVAVDAQIRNTYPTPGPGQTATPVPDSTDVREMPARMEFYTTADESENPALRMVIKNSGNVGIGVTNPGHRLVVGGNVYATDDVISGAGAGLKNLSDLAHSPVTIPGAAGYASLSGQVLTLAAIDLGATPLAEVTGTLPPLNGGTGRATWTAGSLVFADTTSLNQDNSNLFWDNANNRLGIGISSPAAPLDVEDSDERLQVFPNVPTGAVTVRAPDSHLRFEAGNVSNLSGQMTFQVFTKSGDNTDAFRFKAAGGAEVFTILGHTGDRPDGCVGLGTADPMAKFHLHDGAENGFAYAMFTNDTTEPDPVRGMVVGLGVEEDADIANFEVGKSVVIWTNSGPNWNDFRPRASVDSKGNFILSEADLGTGAEKVIAIDDGTGPSSTPSGGFVIYSDNGVGKARDASGNDTLLTSHNPPPTGFQPDDAMPHSLHSYNVYVGKEVTADVTGALRDLEEVTGKQYVFVDELPEGKKRDWWADQEATKARVEAQRRETALKSIVEIPWEKAVEQVVETKRVPREVEEPGFKLDAASGALVQGMVKNTVYDEIPTGEISYRFKKGIRFDSKTGKCYGHPEPEDVVIEPYEMREPPRWIADRM